jgi:ArsR family transcriptional regulator
MDWMSATVPHLLDHMALLSDATRCRVLLSVHRHELTVSELCAVLQLPQSTVSRQLKILGDGGWVHARPEGTRRLYSAAPEDLDPPAARLWRLAREQFGSIAVARDDARRLEAVVARRRSRSRDFFASAAGGWDRMRDDLFGKRTSLALLGLIDEEWVVGDLGCGTGAVSEVLAPLVRRVIGVDGSAPMLDEARRRLEGRANVELRQGELEALPLEDGCLDAATLMLVLHHLPDPAAVLAEVARVLRPGGRLLLVDMLPHDRHEYQQQMGHVWLGFAEDQIARLLKAAGLASLRFRELGPDAEARGPALFAAGARRNAVR